MQRVTEAQWRAIVARVEKKDAVAAQFLAQGIAALIEPNGDVVCGPKGTKSPLAFNERSGIMTTAPVVTQGPLVSARNAFTPSRATSAKSLHELTPAEHLAEYKRDRASYVARLRTAMGAESKRVT